MASVRLNIDDDISATDDTTLAATEDEDLRNGAYMPHTVTIVIITGALLVLVLMTATIISLVMFIRRRVINYKQTISELHLQHVFQRNAEQEEAGFVTHYVSSTSLNLDHGNHSQVQFNSSSTHA